MNETDFTSANILSRLFSSLSVDKLKESSDVMNAWQQTLYSIKGFQNDGSKPADYGSQLADHSQIIDLNDGVLIVETDHPGRIQMFQLYKNYILNGLKQKIPGIPIRNIVFKLNKIKNVSGELRMPTREEMDKAVAEQSGENAGSRAAYAASTADQNAASETAPSLPPELQEMFASMKADIDS